MSLVERIKAWRARRRALKAAGTRPGPAGVSMGAGHPLGQLGGLLSSLDGPATINVPPPYNGGPAPTPPPPPPGGWQNVPTDPGRVQLL